jgi:hypothetical protein
MLVRFALGALLLGIGMLAGAFIRSNGGAGDSPAVGAVAAPFKRGTSTAVTSSRDEGRYFARWERRIDLLAAKVEQEAAERRRLQERIEAVAEQLAALHLPLPGGAEVSPASRNVAPPPEPQGVEALHGDAVEQAPLAGGENATERALIAAGVDPSAAAEITRRRDLLALDEIYVRNQAAREGWLDSPRFAEEMAAIGRERLSMRDEIGDDAYDRYLVALGHPNRVRVDEVLIDSPAAEAGLLPGDVVLRYGDARIFAPADLVDETHSGTVGERVRLEIMRQGQPIAIDVPRGPLGIRIAASRASPDEG